MNNPSSKRKKVHPLPLMNGYKESEYNIYSGQNVCNFRDSNFRHVLTQDYTNIFGADRITYQQLYDMGCSVIDLEIVKQKNGQWFLNQYFPDYESWKHNENVVIDNCILLGELGHQLF